MTTGRRVVVVGSVNEDVIVMLEVPIAPGGTVLARVVGRAPGGKGLNQAVASARAGAETILVGCVGDDDEGRRLVETASEAGVGVSHVRLVPGATTGRAYVLVDPAGASTIVVDPGANAELVADAICALGEEDLLLAQLEVPIGTVRTALVTARRCAALSVLSPSPVVPGARELLPLADVVVCSESEARALLGAGELGAGELGAGESKSDLDLARRLVGLGAKACLVTLGADGAVLATSNGAIRIEPVAVDRVEDTTGAGDAATGTFGAALAEGRDLEAAATLAMRAGAIAVGRIGAQGPFAGGDPRRSAVR